VADYMRAQFKGEPEVEVLLDRRSGRDRRTRANAVDVNRRSADDRRRYRRVNEQLRENFHALVTVG
jgi:hypothetical protein